MIYIGRMPRINKIKKKTPPPQHTCNPSIYLFLTSIPIAHQFPRLPTRRARPPIESAPDHRGVDLPLDDGVLDDALDVSGGDSREPDPLAVLLAVDDDVGAVLMATDVVDEHDAGATGAAVRVVAPEVRGAQVLLELARQDRRADAAARVAVAVRADQDQECVRPRARLQRGRNRRLRLCRGGGGGGRWRFRRYVGVGVGVGGQRRAARRPGVDVVAHDLVGVRGGDSLQHRERGQQDDVGQRVLRLVLVVRQRRRRQVARRDHHAAVLDDGFLRRQRRHHAPLDLLDVADPVRLPRRHDDVRRVCLHLAPQLVGGIDANLVERAAVAGAAGGVRDRTRIAVVVAVAIVGWDGWEQRFLRGCGRRLRARGKQGAAETF